MAEATTTVLVDGKPEEKPVSELTHAERQEQVLREHANSLISRAAEEAAIERARSYGGATLYSMQKAEREELARVRNEKISKVADGASQDEAIAHVEKEFGKLGEASDEDAARLVQAEAIAAQKTAKEQAKGAAKAAKAAEKSDSDQPVRPTIESGHASDASGKASTSKSSAPSSKSSGSGSSKK